MSPHHARSLQKTLNEKGFRLTYQRKIILNLFQALPPRTQLSAKSLYTLLQNSKEYISLSAIYRTLEVLSSVGILQEYLSSNRHKLYELNLKKSNHILICHHCKHTQEFSDEIILGLIEEPLTFAEYQILDCQLILYVLCPQAWHHHLTEKLTQYWMCDRTRPQPTLSQSPDN